MKTVQESYSKKQLGNNEIHNNIGQLLNSMDSHEISHLQFINIEKHSSQLLIASSWDSSLKVFDEEIPDSSLLLRHSVGGHIKEDISCTAVCTDLSLVATGSCSGIVAVS